MSKEDKSSQDRKRNSKIWMIVSLLLSVLILGWAFSLPFRSSSLSFVDSHGDDVSSVVDRSGQRSVERSQDAEEFRAAAIAMEQDFMRELRERNALKKVPGKKEVMLHWNKHVELVKKQIAELGHPEKDTMEWHDKQVLIKSLQDGPLTSPGS